LTVTRQDFEDAIAAYWGAKQLQNEQSAIKAAVGAGTAGSVRGGKHFDVIATLLAKFFLDAGFPPESIRVSKSQGLELPGYYRPQKQWDLVVVHQGVLVAAFEMKALGGRPSATTTTTGERKHSAARWTSAAQRSPSCTRRRSPGSATSS
jgi:hypothetical protein